jgi:hypothetical protein
MVTPHILWRLSGVYAPFREVRERMKAEVSQAGSQPRADAAALGEPEAGSRPRAAGRSALRMQQSRMAHRP